MASFRLMVTVLAIGIMSPLVALAASMPSGTTDIATSSYYNHSTYSGGGHHSQSLTDLQLSVGVGECISDLVELRGNLLYRTNSLATEGSSGLRDSSFGASGTVIFNFKADGPYVPYLQAGLGVLGHAGNDYRNEATSVLLPILAGGTRVLIGNSAALDFGALYQHITNDGGVPNLSANQVFISLGISLLLHRKHTP
jgi:hypothetical protein